MVTELMTPLIPGAGPPPTTMASLPRGVALMKNAPDQRVKMLTAGRVFSHTVSIFDKSLVLIFQERTSVMTAG
jgi:hypothetical protein